MSHALGIGNPDEEVEVAGKKGESTDLDRVECLGSAEDTEEDVIESWSGPQEITALDGTAGDFDEGAFFWDEAELS